MNPLYFIDKLTLMCIDMLRAGKRKQPEPADMNDEEMESHYGIEKQHYGNNKYMRLAEDH